MSQILRVLIVEDNPADAELVLRELRRAGFEPEWERTDTEADYLDRLRPDLDIILSDYQMPQFGGPWALELLKQRGLDIPFMIISGTIGEDIAVDVMKQGATDYLLKDRLTRLGPAVTHALEQARLRRERKQSVEELRLFRTFVDQSNDSFEIIDPETARFLDVNERGCIRLGYSRAEYLALRLFDIEPTITPATWPQVAERIRTTGSLSGEGSHRRKDGTTFPVEFNAKWVRLDRDYIVTVVRDITERKRAEERVREQAAMLDRAHDAISVRGFHDRKVRYWNKGAENLYGWPAADAIGRDIGELIGVDPGKLDGVEEQLLKTGEWHAENRQRSKNGKGLMVSTRATLIRDATGEPKAVLSIDTDITEQKDLEARFLRAQRMESIGTLAGGIAHDLNNVLGPIIMSLDLLKMKFPDPDSQELLAIIGSSAQHGADMVRQVLSFARGIEGRRVEVQVKHVLREIEKIGNDTFLKNIRVRTIIPSDLWTITGDPTQLHQVLLNLCVNARDAMPTGGALTLSAENLTLDEQYAGLNPEAKAGPYVLLKVMDTGTGMPPEVIEKIFDPFFTTKEIGKGTGLGLSTSLGIVKSHGGFIRVESEPGKGTKFEVYLPAQTEASADTATESAAEMLRGHGELILVVDDESSARRITQQTLEAFDYRVVLASEGAEAVAIYSQRKGEIAAVLTDMMMPVMDGPATIQVLRRMDPDLPIIVASGLSTSNQIAHATSLGVKHFLPKPYTAETLLKTLGQILKEES